MDVAIIMADPVYRSLTTTSTLGRSGERGIGRE